MQHTTATGTDSFGTEIRFGRAIRFMALKSLLDSAWPQQISVPSSSGDLLIRRSTLTANASLQQNITQIAAKTTKITRFREGAIVTIAFLCFYFKNETYSIKLMQVNFLVDFLLQPLFKVPIH
jgi:hypothetical protein